jgi:hypothetical protein
MPAVAGLFVVIHVLLVRVHGVVPPIDAAKVEAPPASTAPEREGAR